MKKSIISLGLALMMVVSTAFGTFAATGAASNAHSTVKNCVAFTLKDIKRLVEPGHGAMVKAHDGYTPRIVNAKQLDSTKWVIRVNGLGNPEEGSHDSDFLVTAITYQYDKTQAKVVQPSYFPTTMSDVEAGSQLYGPCWYLFGLFDDNDHEICGLGLAVRISDKTVPGDNAARWPLPGNLDFSGMTRGTLAQSVVGSYTNPSSDDFLDKYLFANLR